MLQQLLLYVDITLLSLVNFVILVLNFYFNVIGLCFYYLIWYEQKSVKNEVKCVLGCVNRVVTLEEGYQKNLKIELHCLWSSVRSTCVPSSVFLTY